MLHIFPIGVKDELFHDYAQVLSSFTALSYFEPFEYDGRIFHAVGERESGISVIQG